ncbi:g8629 [Coccomyxa elongata]
MRLLALVLGLRISCVVLVEGASTSEPSAAFLGPLEGLADQATSLTEQLLAPVVGAAEKVVDAVQKAKGTQFEVTPETSRPLQSITPSPTGTTILPSSTTTALPPQTTAMPLSTPQSSSTPMVARTSTPMVASTSPVAPPTTPTPTSSTAAESTTPGTPSTPPPTSTIASTTIVPNTTTVPNTTIVPSTTPAGPCLKNGTCIDATSGLNLTTSADTCTNATGYCAPTGVYSVCTAQCGGSCVPTNTSYALCATSSKPSKLARLHSHVEMLPPASVSAERTENRAETAAPPPTGGQLPEARPLH